MNLIRSLIGRRQFLVAAGVTSALGLGFKKLTGVFNSGIQTGAAMASEKSKTANIKRDYSDRYSHLLSSLRIGNVVLKNRMMQADSFPRFLQGPETFPSEQIIFHYGNIAKNGCAICMCFGGQTIQSRKELQGEMKHMAMWDPDDPSVQHYYAQMVDAIHFYGSKAAIGLHLTSGAGYNISNIGLRMGMEGMAGEAAPGGKEIPVDEIQKIYEEAATQAKFYQSLGFDMVNFHMSYHNGLLANALSPVYNKRTDKYGGSIENRARLPLELFQAIKKACGQDFLVGANISGEEGGGGYTAQDAAEYAKIWEGSLDILVVRGKDQQASHPNGYDSIKGKPVTLPYAQAIKEGGSKVVIVPNGGYQDLDFNEECIATGKADMICMARPWFADPEYGKKAYEGRGEDVIPCLLCAVCSGGDGSYRPPINMCAVNPTHGKAHKIERMIDAPTVSRKVAVIGGGPAGMRAAIVAAERGHKVTLYEKNDFLGGQLKHVDYASFQWPYKDFKDYLIRQTYKAGVEVLLSAKATAEMIMAKGYDAVIAATGAEPIIPDIPGVKGSNVRASIFVFGDEKSLGKNVVVIGGGAIGLETGRYLTETDHKVILLTREKSVLATEPRIINLSSLGGERLVNFSKITEVTATGISEGKVTYADAKGNKQSIQADSVVVYAGRKPRVEEAMKFSGTAKRFFIVGDCSEVGDVRNSQRTAFNAASQI